MSKITQTIIENPKAVTAAFATLAAAGVSVAIAIGALAPDKGNELLAQVNTVAVSVGTAATAIFAVYASISAARGANPTPKDQAATIVGAINPPASQATASVEAAKEVVDNQHTESH